MKLTKFMVAGAGRCSNSVLLIILPVQEINFLRVPLHPERDFVRS